MLLQDPEDGTLARLCGLYCSTGHVDLCDTRHIPGLGDLNTRYPVGRLWRFQVTCAGSGVPLISRLPPAPGGPDREEVRVSRCGRLDPAAGESSCQAVGGEPGVGPY